MIKAKSKRISSIVLILLLLSFSAIATNVLSVSADEGGIGKFVDIEVVGGGSSSVTLIKLSSGETWNTQDAPPINKLNEKVGAGTVKLVAEEEGNYIIDYWEIGYEKDNEGKIINPTTIKDLSPEFKTTKGTTYVKAYFVEVFTITALVASDTPYGTILLGEGDGVATEIPRGYIVTFKYYEGQPYDKGRSFSFEANSGYHISAIQVDDKFDPYALSYEFTNVHEDHSLIVYFSKDGQAYVPAGENVEAYFAAGASLIFPGEVTNGGTAKGIDLECPETWGAFMWDISTLEIVYVGGNVIITLVLIGEYDITEVLVLDAISAAFYCDVNGDGFVTAADLSLVANYNKVTATNPNEFPYDPLYDTDGDGEITEDDIHMVNEHKGEPVGWVSLDENYWDSVALDGLTTVTIQPDHFSIFRGR